MAECFHGDPLNLLLKAMPQVWFLSKLIAGFYSKKT